ncbi:MAG: hypothetical protein MR430_09600 [Lachnospiraceae bacterium]|nr:hypothetical protein [Lachnospiraceae bacterium]
MAKNRIPEEIKQYRPGPCTEVKLSTDTTTYIRISPNNFQVEVGESRPEKALEQ